MAWGSTDPAQSTGAEFMLLESPDKIPLRSALSTTLFEGHRSGLGLAFGDTSVVWRTGPPSKIQGIDLDLFGDSCHGNLCV
jgi:hypothetical protein